MNDLKTQLRTYYEATTTPVDVDNIAADAGKVLVGPAPDTAQRRSAMTDIKTPGSQTWWRSYRAAAVALVGVFALIAVFVFIAGDPGKDSVADPDAVAVVRAYEEAYNAGDLEAVLALFSDQAVVTGHPNYFRAPSVYEGIAAITELIEVDMRSGGKYVFTELGGSGDTVEFTHRWSNPTTCGTAAGHSMRVVNGKIVDWTWPERVSITGC